MLRHVVEGALTNFFWAIFLGIVYVILGFWKMRNTCLRHKINFYNLNVLEPYITEQKRTFPPLPVSVPELSVGCGLKMESAPSAPGFEC